MPDETPIFSSTPAPEIRPPSAQGGTALGGKKRRPSSVVERRKTPVRTKKMTAAKTSSARSEMNQTLASLYKNNADSDVRKIDIKKSSAFGRFFSRLLIAAVVVGIVIWIGARLAPAHQAPPKDTLAVVISGPTMVSLGAPVTYTIEYKNNDTVAMNNVRLNINYPAGFVLAKSSVLATNAKQNEWALGTLAPRASGALTLTGAEFAPLGASESWRVFIKYSPTNFKSELQTAATLAITLATSPLSLALAGPDTASLGQAVAYVFTVKNTGLTALPGLFLMPQLPSGFTLVSSTPGLNKNRWTVSPASAATATSTLAQTVFKLVGKFTDNTAVSSSLSGLIAFSIPNTDRVLTVASSTIITALSKNNLDFNLAINGTLGNFDAQPGDTLNATVRLKNNTDHNLKNASLTLVFDAPANDKNQSVLNWSELNEPYNADVFGKKLSDTMRRGSITWNSQTIPELAKVKPGEEISVDVRLPIKDGKNFDLSALTASAIMARAAVDFADDNGAKQTLESNRLAITLNSDLVFSEKTERLINGAGKKQFAGHWVLANSFHALKNISLSADVFGDVALSYVSSSIPAGSVAYDAKTQKLTWHIPDMPVSVDTLALPFTIVLNKDNPTQNTLISKVHVTADDTVTGKTMDFMGEEVSLLTE